MIDTKEQYRGIIRRAANTPESERPTERDHLIETIEALREVARAAEIAMEIEQAHWSNYGTLEQYENKRLTAATKFWTLRRALSDWLVE